MKTVAVHYAYYNIILYRYLRYADRYAYTYYVYNTVYIIVGKHFRLHTRTTRNNCLGRWYYDVFTSASCIRKKKHYYILFTDNFCRKTRETNILRIRINVLCGYIYIFFICNSCASSQMYCSDTGRCVTRFAEIPRRDITWFRLQWLIVLYNIIFDIYMAKSFDGRVSYNYRWDVEGISWSTPYNTTGRGSSSP